MHRGQNGQEADKGAQPKPESQQPAKLSEAAKLVLSLLRKRGEQ